MGRVGMTGEAMETGFEVPRDEELGRVSFLPSTY